MAALPAHESNSLRLGTTILLARADGTQLHEEFTFAPGGRAVLSNFAPVVVQSGGPLLLPNVGSGALVGAEKGAEGTIALALLAAGVGLVSGALFIRRRSPEDELTVGGSGVPRRAGRLLFWLVTALVAGPAVSLDGQHAWARSLVAVVQRFVSVSPDRPATVNLVARGPSGDSALGGAFDLRAASTSPQLRVMFDEDGPV